MAFSVLSGKSRCFELLHEYRINERIMKNASGFIMRKLSEFNYLSLSSQENFQDEFT